MPKKPLTDKEIQNRLEALERQGMNTGGGVYPNTYGILPAGFDYTQLPGYVAPNVTLTGGGGNNTIPAEFISSDGTVSTKADTGFGAQGTIDFLTQAQKQGLTTENSTFEQSQLSTFAIPRGVSI